MTKRKFHVRTDNDGYTWGSRSHHDVELGGNFDEKLGLKPDTDYTVTVTEGKPEAEYPRYFITNRGKSLYRRFPRSDSRGIVVGHDGDVCYSAFSMYSLINDPDIREVSYEEAERHIGREQEPNQIGYNSPPADENDMMPSSTPSPHAEPVGEVRVDPSAG